MIIKESYQSVRQFLFREKAMVILRENRKLIFSFILTALFIYLAAWFITHEKTELSNAVTYIRSANAWWVAAGLFLAAVYIVLRGLMYVTSFSSISIHVSVRDAVILFLKRNFISVFLPAGGVSSLVFFTTNVERKGITKSQIFFASSINAFTGILTVVIVAVPAFLFLVTGGAGSGKWIALGGVAAIMLSFIVAFYSLIRKKSIYKLACRLFPRWVVIIEDMSNHRIKTAPFIYTILLSMIVELTGIAHVYISMTALGIPPSITVSIISYIVVVIFMVISPFLRGLGAIEVSMSYILTQYGFSSAEAISITLLFRFFEFWVPLFTGLLSFLHKMEKLFLRTLPAILIFSLGIVNIISVLTPALPERMKLLRDFLFMDVISFSNSFVLITGLLLMLTAAFMLKGLRTSWWFALLLSAFSIIGHLLKGIDYEESLIAATVLGSLLATRREYYIRSDPRLGYLGVQTAFLSIGAVLIFGIIGFYYLDRKHFQIDFNILQSVKYTLLNFFLAGSRQLVPADMFARDFLNLIRISGAITMAFMFYTVLRPYIYKDAVKDEEKDHAFSLVKQFGRSSLDYFKTYSDKLIFTPVENNAFISYRVSRHFAVALEDPVAQDISSMKKCISSFSLYCYRNGLKDIYYRVPAESLKAYNELSRKSLFIGQEAIVDLNTFSLAGGEKKPLRNALNRIKAEGYVTRIYAPPLRDGLIQKLKAVSEEWLKTSGRTEIMFSQGIFDEKEIKQQTVLTVENNEEKIIAFLNIIPDYAKDEGTYDLLRKTASAPNGIMDHMIVEMFNYFRAAGIRFVNLGFAPMSGVNDPHNFPERSMKFAYDKIRSFSHYRGMREYKEKFNPEWHDKYLVYSNDYDLLQIPAVLGSVIRS